MTILHLDPLGTTTSLSLTSTVEDIVDTVDDQTTLVTAVGSTITSVLSNPRYSYCDMANRYVDSLTDQQLVEMDKLLQEKEDSFVFTLGDNVVEVEKPKVYKK